LIDGDIFQQRSGCADAGIVEQDIEPPEGPSGLVEEAAHGLGLRHVRRHHQRSGLRARLGNGLLQRVFAAARQNDGVPFTQEADRGRSTDSRSRTGDDRYFRSSGHAAQR
jgi:hypothetical protein